MSAFLNIQFGEIEKDKSRSDIEVFFEHNGLGRTYAEFPKAKFTPGFVCLSETVLLDIFSANKETWAITKQKIQALGTMVVKKADAQAFVQDHKAFLIDALFGHNGFKDVSLQDQTEMKTKLKLKGTVCTNGLVLHALAYDISVLRHKAAREAAGDDVDEADEQDYVDDAFLEIEDIISDTDLDNLDQVDMESNMDGTDVQDLEVPTEIASQSVYKGYAIN
jgi:hypothetical protein